jgi:hypothetical protein
LSLLGSGESLLVGGRLLGRCGLVDGGHVRLPRPRHRTRCEVATQRTTQARRQLRDGLLCRTS